jgi:hypothetical protein
MDRYRSGRITAAFGPSQGTQAEVKPEIFGKIASHLFFEIWAHKHANH